MTHETHDVEEEIHFSDYINVVMNRKGIVLSFLFITVFITAVFTYTAKPVFQATSKIVIGENNKVSPISGRPFSMDSYYAEEKNFNTHFQLITSKPVLKMVADAVDLSDTDHNNDLESINPLIRYGLRVKKNVKLIKNAVMDYIKQFMPKTSNTAHVIPVNPKDKLYRMLLSRISVTPIEDTRIMEITVLDTDPVRTSAIANALAKKYIEFDLSTKLKASADKLKWMTNELYGVKKKLEDAEKGFIKYKQDEKMFSMKGKQSVINEKIANFNRKYLEARNKKLELDSSLKELTSSLGRSNNIMRIKSMVDDPIINELYSMLTKLEIEKGRMSKVYRAKHPKMVEITSKIDSTRAKFKIELEKKLNSIRRERDIAVSQEREMKRQISQFESEAMQASKKELSYNIHQRNVNTSQQLYDILLSQIKESNILQSSEASNLTIVEKADIPEKPVKPDKERNFLLSIILGIFGGIGLAFFLEYMDQTIRNEDEAEKFLGYPVLAIVPDANISSSAHGGY